MAVTLWNLPCLAAEPESRTSGAPESAAASPELSPQSASSPESAAAPESTKGSEEAVAEAAQAQTQAQPSRAESSQENLQPTDLSAASLHKMENDLEIVMQAVSDAPQVSVCTSLAAGSRFDPVSAPGAYRVLAEILKDGGYQSPSQDYVALVASRGGVSEVEVTHETTTFCTTLPAGELPLALWVSAGRYSAGKLTEANLKAAVERLAAEAEARDAEVLEGRAQERLRKMAFLGNYSYSHPTLPGPDDLDLISLETIRQLHRESYVARRSKVAIVGGFSEAVAVEEFPAHLFAARPGEVLPKKVSELVPQKTGRFSMAEDVTAKTPAAWYAWVAPPGEHRRALEVALAALVSEKRLRGKLVGGGRAAKSLELYLDEDSADDAPSLQRIQIVGSTSQSLGTIESGFNRELTNLLSSGLTEEEVSNLEKQLIEQRKLRLVSALDRAKALSRGALLGRSTRDILAPLRETPDEGRVTPEDVKLAAARFLDPLRKSTIEVYPKGWQDPWQSPMQKWHIVEKGQTLGTIANLHGTSVQYLTQINKIKQTATIYPGDKLRVPRGKAKAEKAPRTHRVRRGDTLSSLAVKYGVGVRAIADANGMGSKLTIRTGEDLVIPWGAKASDDKSDAEKPAPGTTETTTPESSTHVVKSGETLSGVAHQHGVSTVALAQKNGISHKAMVKVGQTLLVPPRGTGKRAVSQVSYTVKSGDTLSGIAKKHGVSVKALTSENGIGRTSTLRPGQTLRIPASP